MTRAHFNPKAFEVSIYVLIEVAIVTNVVLNIYQTTNEFFQNTIIYISR